MSEMIDRVAKAISGAPFPSKCSLKKARAAIEAMREPTDAMIKGNDEIYASRTCTVCLGAVEGYRRMIDEALK